MSEDVPSKLKQLEEKTFPSEVALFDALKEAGVPGLGDYRSGSRNKNLARKNAARYVVYKKLQEIDPACTRKNALIITTVYNEPLPVEDNRGRSGKYINELKPLIVHTGKFEGTKTELFDQWEMYDQYKQKYLTSEDGSKSGRVINPWTITAFTEPGAERYYKKISFLESSTLKTALGSLERDGVLAWDNILYYTPEIGVMISSYDEDSPEWEQAKAEWTKARDSRLLTVETLSSEENCVLNPELFFAGYGDFEGYFDWYLKIFRQPENIARVDRAIHLCGFRDLDDFSAFIDSMLLLKGDITPTPEEIESYAEEFAQQKHRFARHPEPAGKEEVLRIYTNSLLNKHR